MRKNVSAPGVAPAAASLEIGGPPFLLQALTHRPELAQELAVDLDAEAAGVVNDQGYGIAGRPRAALSRTHEAGEERQSVADHLHVDVHLSGDSGAHPAGRQGARGGG